MPRKPSKKKLIEIFEVQYLMSEQKAKDLIRQHAKSKLSSDLAHYVDLYSVCGGVSSALDTCLSCFYTYGIPMLDPIAVDLRVLYFVEPTLGDVELRKLWYRSDNELKSIDDKKAKAMSEMLAVFGYTP